jgi:hypothetical protein
MDNSLQAGDSAGACHAKENREDEQDIIGCVYLVLINRCIED